MTKVEMEKRLEANEKYIAKLLDKVDSLTEKLENRERRIENDAKLINFRTEKLKEANAKIDTLNERMKERLENKVIDLNNSVGVDTELNHILYNEVLSLIITMRDMDINVDYEEHHDNKTMYSTMTINSIEVVE